MIESQWLANVFFTTVKSSADISRVKAAANGDFQASELSKALNTDQINDITVRAWLTKASGRKSTIVFCADIAHVVGVTNMFRKHGVDARFITGDTPKQTRSQVLDAFKGREFPVLVNCGVFTEGTDIPNIDCVLLARPTKSRNLLVQMIGRGMRLYAGKENCHVIDMVASLESGIVTTPTLFGLDPSVVVEVADIGTMQSLKDRQKIEQSRQEQTIEVTGRPSASSAAVPGTITFTDYDSVLDLISDTSGERHIRAISPHAWVQTGPNKYILGSNESKLTIEKTDDGLFMVRLKEKLHVTKSTLSPYARPRELARAETFEDIVHAADTYAAEKLARFSIAKDQAWRKRPASKEQLDFLNNFKPEDKQLTEGMLTKGRAADMITKIVSGARGQWGKMASAKRKIERTRGRLHKLRSREEVRVGPMQA